MRHVTVDPPAQGIKRSTTSTPWYGVHWSSVYGGCRGARVVSKVLGNNSNYTERERGLGGGLRERGACSPYYTTPVPSELLIMLLLSFVSLESHANWGILEVYRRARDE